VDLLPAPSPARAAVLATVADEVLRLDPARVRRVAVDGVDGSGKSVFGDELARELTARGASVLRASVDGFHRPRAERHARGRTSPEGFFHDSYDYAALRSRLLDPVGPGGDRTVRTAVFDWRTDTVVDVPAHELEPGDVLLVDGIFLHRDELAAWWDFSVYLDVDFAETFARMAVRDGCPPDPAHPANARYVEGQRRYLAACRPAARATVVVDNRDLAHPRLLPHG
jgi:uridine kinase